jgi:hypothetical protein
VVPVGAREVICDIASFATCTHNEEAGGGGLAEEEEGRRMSVGRGVGGAGHALSGPLFPFLCLFGDKCAGISYYGAIKALCCRF